MSSAIQKASHFAKPQWRVTVAALAVVVTGAALTSLTLGTLTGFVAAFGVLAITGFWSALAGHSTWARVETMSGGMELAVFSLTAAALAAWVGWR